MKRPRLVSPESLQEIYVKKFKRLNNKISEHFTLFLLIFLMIGICIIYYKYKIKQLSSVKATSKFIKK